MIFSADETAPTWAWTRPRRSLTDYKERDNKFTGKIHKVTVDVNQWRRGQGGGRTATRGHGEAGVSN